MPPVALSHPETSDSPAPDFAPQQAQEFVGECPEQPVVPDDIHSLDYFAIEGERARLNLQLRQRMENQRAGHEDQEQQ